MPFMYDEVADSMLDYIADNGDRIILCSAEPSTFTEANVTYNLAYADLTPGDGSGDYAITDLAAGGRKLTLTAPTDMDVDATDTATHWAIVDTDNSKLLVTQALNAGVALTAGNKVSFSDDIIMSITDPT